MAVFLKPKVLWWWWFFLIWWGGLQSWFRIPSVYKSRQMGQTLRRTTKHIPNTPNACYTANICCFPPSHTNHIFFLNSFTESSDFQWKSLTRFPKSRALGWIFFLITMCPKITFIHSWKEGIHWDHMLFFRFPMPKLPHACFFRIIKKHSPWFRANWQSLECYRHGVHPIWPSEWFGHFGCVGVAKEANFVAQMGASLGNIWRASFGTHGLCVLGSWVVSLLQNVLCLFLGCDVGFWAVVFSRCGGGVVLFQKTVALHLPLLSVQSHQLGVSILADCRAFALLNPLSLF